jgi:hypothetical protein
LAFIGRHDRPCAANAGGASTPPRGAVREPFSVGGRLGALLLVLAAEGCASLGPRTVVHDRVNYISAVADSWKEQTLTNVVRLRYGDAPSFVDVSSVISSYTFTGTLTASGLFNSNGTPSIPASSATVGGNAGYVDRPTITYTPLMGDKFARSLLKPIPPSAIFDLIQAGYPSDRILQLTTRAINGIYNRSTVGEETREADPEFYPLLKALRALQLSGAVSMRLEKRGADQVGILVFSRKVGATNPDYRFVLKTLGIRPGEDGEITLTFGAQPRGDKEIAVLSRSMLSILLEVANGIEAPSADVSAGRTSPAGRTADAQNPGDRPLVRILSGPKPPSDAYTAVHYRNAWYWIPDNDLASKNEFSFLMMFFALAESGPTPNPPVLTIPAG